MPSAELYVKSVNIIITMANVLLHLLPVLWLLNTVHTSSDCSMKRTSSLRFRAKSGVNELGQRTVSVKGLGEAHVADSVGVTVDHWTAICHDMQVLGIQVNVTGPTISIDTTDITSITEISTEDAVPIVTDTITTEEQNITTEQPTTTALHCKPGYTLVSSIGCYKRNRTALSWDAARLSCETEGAHLATPDSEQELDALETISWRARIGRLWVGVRKLNGAWQTVEGGPGFLQWYPGQPNGDGDCVVLWDSNLYDNNCDNERYSICVHSPM